MTKVLLVDKLPVVRVGLRVFLEHSHNSGIEVIGEAETSEEGLRLSSELHPDVVVMDLSLSDTSALETARSMLQTHQSTKVLIISSQHNELLVTRARESGIKGFINKKCSAESLITAIQTLADGGTCFEEIPAVSRKNPVYWGINLLTPRELEVFRHLAEGNTVNEISKMLKTSPKTIGVHQTRIIKKLGVANSAQLAHLALREGLIDLQAHHADSAEENADVWKSTASG
jgi:DNA-binding NarL/FixJ family response regulator